MRVKLIRLLFMAILAMGTATACFDGLSADVSESDVRRGRKFTTAMYAASMQHEIETKSLLGSRSDAAVYNWNLFVFDGGILVGKYYKSSGEDIEFDVKLDHYYEFMAVANVGNKTNLFGAGATKTDVASMELTDVSSGYSTNGLPMAWASSSPIQFTKAQYDSHTASLDIQMTRLTGKYEIAVNKHGLNMWSFRVKSLVMKGASAIKPFSSSANAAASYSTVSDQATAADVTLLDTYNSMDVSSPAVFYPLENVMDTPASLSGNTDPWNKVQERVPGNKYPTYVEMVAEATLQDGSGITKDVTYRFYLGNNATNDFRVERNVSHSLTFYPDDESITNGHMGNWKITPGPFDDTRDLDFARQTTADTRYRVRAGTSDVESIVKVPSALKYVVKKSTDNITVKNTSTGAVIGNNTVTDASSLTLDIAAGVKQTAEVTIETIDGALSDVLHLDIFNAYLEITDPVPAVRNWGWNTYGTLSAQTFTVRTSVDFTMTAPSGWSASKSLVSESAGEKVWTITVYPESPCTVETAPGESLSLVFRNSEIDDVTATLTRDFKPMVSVDKNNLTWIASKAGENDGINVSVTSNESWTVTKASGWDDNKWGISTTSGSGNGTIKVWPKTANATIPPVDVTTLFTILPNRGTDAEKATVNMTHQKPAVNLDITEDGNAWTWKSTEGFTFHVTGNVNWQASLNNTSKWEFVGASTGSGNGTVTVRPKAQNLSVTDLVSGTLSLACTDAGITVTPAPTASLQQGVHPNIALASSDNLQWAWNATDAKGITLTLSPEGYGWQAQLVNGEASHWQMTENHTNNTISIQPKGVNDDVNNTLSVQVRITATDPDDTQSSAVVTCTHNKREPYFYFVDPTQQNLSWRWYENASNTVVVNFSTSETWSHTVSSGSSYFSATQNGNSLTIAPVGANTGGARNGAISIEVVGHPELNKTITLAQEARPTVSVTPAGYDWAWTATSADAQSFTVTCTPGYTWSASKTDANNKFSLSGTTGASGAAFTAGPVGTNEDTENAYSATVIVTLVNAGDPHAGDISVNVPLSQARKVQFYITPTSHDWGWQGGSFNFTVVDNQGLSWTPEVVGTDASSFVATKSGNTVSVNVGSNSSYSSKSATLRIKVGSEVKAEATLSQEAHPSLSIAALDGTSWAYNETGGKRYSVSTSGISSWSASIDNTSDFTVSTSGNIVTVTPKNQNSGTTVRNVRLTVSSNNYSVDGEYDYDDLTQGVNGGMVTGATLQVYNGSSWVTNATFTVGAQQSYRVKVDYLSGSSDYVTSGFELTSGNSGIVSVNSNKFSTTAAGEGSTSVSTTYSGINTSVSITVQPPAPTYTYTLAVKESGGDYGTDFEVSATGTLVLEAWLTQRFTNGSSTPDAGFTPVNVTSDVVWEPDATLSSWSSCSSGTVSANATSEPSNKVGVYTVTYGAAVNSPVDVYIEVVDISHYEYDITLDGGHSSVELDYGETVVAQYLRRRISLWNGSSDWSEYGASIGVYDSKYLTTASHNLVSRGIVSKSGSGTVTITNTNETGSVVTGYAKGSYGDASEAITLNPKSSAVVYRVITKVNGKSSDSEYVGGSVTLSATLQQSVNGGAWTNVSTSPSGYTNTGGVSVLGSNYSSVDAPGTGYYRGTFSGYTVDPDECIDAEVTGVPISTTYRVITKVNGKSSDSEYVGGSVTLSATLQQSVNGGAWTNVSTSPSGYTNTGGVSVLGSNYSSVDAPGTGYYRGTFSGYTVDPDECIDAEVTGEQHAVTYDDFTVAMSPESISKGESSYASATIQKYVDGKKDGDPIDVTSLTTFSTSSSFVNKKGSRQFEWKGIGLTDLDVTIQGTLSNGTYGSHSGNATLEVKAEKYPVLFTFDKDSYVVASDAAVTQTCNFSVKVTYSDLSEDYVGSGLIPWSDISIETYSNAFFAGDGEFAAVRANSSTEARLFYKGESKMCTATLTSQNPYELIGINPDISSGEGELYIGFEAEYQYLCQDSAGNMQDNIRVSGIKPTVTPSKISGAGSMTCTWAKLSTSDKFYTITSVSTSKYLFEFYYSDTHGAASIGYYVTKSGGSPSYDVDPADN